MSILAPRFVPVIDIAIPPERSNGIHDLMGKSIAELLMDGPVWPTGKQRIVDNATVGVIKPR